MQSDLNAAITQNLSLIISIDQNNRITLSQNPDGQNFGQETIGQDLRQLYPDHLFVQNLNLALQGQELTTEVRVDSVWFEAKFFPLRSQNEIIGAMCLGLKIAEPPTTKTELPAETSLYRDIFEQVPLGLGIARPDGTLIDFNQAMLRPGDYSPEDIAQLDNNVANLYCHPADRQAILKQLQTKGFVDQFEVGFKRKDGSCYPTLLTLRPFKNESFSGVLAIVQDITNLKEAQTVVNKRAQELEQLNQTLIGRELKMTELKNKIKELEAQINA